jgi:hypothetical protein
MAHGHGRRRPECDERRAIAPVRRRFTADWAKDNEWHAAGQRAEQQRIADFYARLTQEQEERENAEARERAAAALKRNNT